jgi:mannosyltransferase
MVYLDGIIFSLQKYGGISTYFRELHNGLVKRNFRNQLIIYEKDSNFLVKNSNVELFNKRIFERYRSLESLPLNSIFHSSYYRTSKQTNVITLYDFTYEKFGKGFFDKVHINQKKKAIKNADIILCISENTKIDLLNYYPEAVKKKIFVTHLAASNDYFNKGLDYKLRISDPYILFVGARSTYKNFIELVKSMKNFSSLKLYIVGGGDFSNEEILLLQKCCKNRYKHFKNFDNDKLNDLYNSAICLVYPSLYEGFGIPVIEAMSASCPVIASNCSSITEIATGSAILLDETNDVSITEAINKILIEENFDLFRKIGLKNSLNFSWDLTVQKTIDSYNCI